MPAHSASNVSTFGISRLTEKPDSRRTRMRGRLTRTRGRRIANELLFAAGFEVAKYTRKLGLRRETRLKVGSQFDCNSPDLPARDVLRGGRAAVVGRDVARAFPIRPKSPIRI